MAYLIAYLAAATVFIAINIVWIGFLARDFYRAQFGELIANPFNMGAAWAFYGVYMLGMLIFSVGPAISQGSLTHAAQFGALYGFFCYATYDLTNLATLRGYPARLVPLDIAWGTILTTAASVAGYLAAVSISAGV